MTEQALSKSKQDVIRYWDKRPCNSGHSSQTIGSLEFHNQVLEKRYFVEPHILEFADFKSCKGLRVLEIGSGIGTDAFQFAKFGAIVKSGDISSRSIEICNEIKSNLNLGSIDFFCHDFENPILPIDVAFEPDLIYSFGVIHHSPNPGNVFKNLSVWAKPGTKVKIMVYSRLSTKAIALYFKYCLKTRFNFDRAVALQSEAQFGSPYTYTYTHRKIKKILTSSNVKVKKIYKRHIFSYRVAEYKENVYIKRLYWRFLPKSVFDRFERLLGWHLLIEGEISE